MARPRRAECPKGSPAWMVTFTDLVLLILTFFVLLYSMSTIEADRFMEFVSHFRRDGGETILDLEGAQGITEMIGNGIVEFPTPGTPDALTQERETLMERQLTQQMYEQALMNLFPSAFETYFDHFDGTPEVGGWLQWEVLEDMSVEFVIGNEFLFRPGSAALSPEARYLLQGLAVIIEAAFLEGDTIIISGHTDNVPHRGGGGFRDNRDLSYGRARVVMDEIVMATGLPGRVFVLEAWGEYRPVDPFADNDLPENREINRRVEIRIQAGIHTDVAQRFMGHPAQVNDEPEPEYYWYYGDDTDDFTEPGYYYEPRPIESIIEPVIESGNEVNYNENNEQYLYTPET